MTVVLRRAGQDDEELLLAWRNDPVTRASAFQGDPVMPEDHRAWLARKLADPGCSILLAEEDGRAVGQVRLDRIDVNIAEVDIAVASEDRGRGIGRQILILAVQEAPALLGVRWLRAFVKEANAASLATFRAAGFTPVSDNGAVVTFEREVE
jgi:RimJ/RimL family protein N-acetyltransferase